VLAAILHAGGILGLLSLLRSVESISSCRDRDRLPFVFLASVEAFFGGRARAGMFSRDPRNDGKLKFCPKEGGKKNSDFSGAPWTKLARAVQCGQGVILAGSGGRCQGALALESLGLYDKELILVFGADSPIAAEDIGAVESLARIFGNQIRLIDYSERDSLTRLLNRKTFDEMFDRLLCVRSSGENWRHEKRSRKEKGYPAWLGVIDVDHFKRINDSFGHLFGDEVLLRLGNLLRQTFRDSDRLFRFGGEEFVVILNAPGRELAEAGFERFRAAVEKHEFPQVGTVTCSVGFTVVSERDVPIDAVGRADKAMYFVKKCGRNWVCCYEQLLDQGAVLRPELLRAKVAENFDVDGLFD
jgi:diguanylate cyclase (GGDEF)-like protein